ncbi:hypothetical protein DEU56DRAFT_809042 [Suillus clintonianus]|uniref:uncharacterized protein n=1 Tax=Suillus clintonianus TaxID=1904413 RepID=UPI001B875C67|nr:uncharacterized protein DEU56DRAFT_809042 [Suillus clintonianus]KAG2134855.1 hypothetical protein DEU56DRAFT_809042 [Suillus clintonianus]
MAYTAAPRDPPPQSQGFRSISPRPGYPIQHPTQIQIPQLRYPHSHQQPRPPPTSFPNPAPTRRPLPTPKSRPESLPPPARAAQTPAPSRPAPIPAPAPSRPAILAHAASLESTNINNHTRRPLPNPGAKSTKHASLDLRAQLEHNPAEPGLNSAVSSQTSAASFSPFSASSGASSFSSPAPSSSAAQSSAFSNHPPSSAYPNTPPSASFRHTPSHNYSGPGPASSYPHVAPLIDVRALPLSSAPAKFTPHWKRDLPGPGPPPQPNESSSRVGPFMERRSTVSGSAVPSTLGATNSFPAPATSNNYPFARSVSPERDPTSGIDRAQTVIHRAQTQTSVGRRPLPSIGNRSPPVPPLPGSSRSPPQPGSSRSPPVPGSSRSPPAIPGSSQSQPVPGSSRWPPEPGSSRGPPIPDGFRSPPVMSPRPPPISGSSRSPPVPASSVSQMARMISNAPSTSSTLTEFSRLSSSTMHSMHTRTAATTDDESNPSDVGDEYDKKIDGRQEEREYGNRKGDHRQQRSRYNEQKEAHRERDIRSPGEPGNVSPQYGIHDLPRRTHPSQPSQPQAHIRERQWTRTRPTRAATLPTPPSQSPNDIQDNEPQSLTLRMAALGLSPSQSPSHTQNDLSRQPSMHSSMQSSRSSSPSFDLGSHPLLQHVPSSREQELDNLSKRPCLQRGKSVIEGLQRHPFASSPVERRVSGRSRSLVREQEHRSKSPALEQSPIREPSPTRSQWPHNIPPLPRAPLSPAGTSPFSPEFNASGSGGDANSSPTRSAFARPASPVKNSVFHTSGFSRPTSPSKSPLPTPPNSTLARAEAGGAPVYPSPRKASGGKGPFGSQNQNSRPNSPQKSSNAYASPTLPSSTSPPKLAYLSSSSARNAFPPSAFPSSFPSHPTTSNSHIMERQRQKQRAYVSTYDLDDEPPVSPLRERVGLPSPNASRSPSPSDFGARVGGRSASRGRTNKDQDYGYCNEDDGDERSPSPIRFAKRSSTQFSVLEMDFVGGQDVPKWHRTPASRSAGGRTNDEGRRADVGAPVISLPGGHVDFDQDSDNGGGAAVPSSKTHESPPRIAVSSATPPRVTGSRATPPRVAVTSSTPPRVTVNASTPPRIAVSGSSSPRIAVSGSPPSPPQSSVSSPSTRQTSVSSPSTPKISVSIPSSSPRQPTSWHTSAPSQEKKRLPPPPGQTGPRGGGGQNNVFNAQSAGKISGVLSGMRGNGLSCAGCGGPIIGRIVSAMGQRWHPGCFCCSACNELLEHVSSFEHEGKPYCHLDYHENFAPRCYHCKTAIIDERFITLDDEALGKRTYHEQHFFCAECGDPFLPPSSGNGGLTVTGDGEFDLDDDVGFTVYKGHPYCEACHVRLRMPKCKGCKKSIRDGMRAVEALGGKWCWECFVCEGCKNPFEDPSFFLRENKPFCEPCFSLILRNEV